MGCDRNKIESFIAPIVEAMGYIVWCIELKSSKYQTLLRVYIDVHAGGELKGVSLGDCALISNQIGALLDVEDCISGRYVLEVSSPGLDRGLFKLEHYQRYIGSVVKIVLCEPQDGRSNFTGKILDVIDDGLKMEVDKELVDIELSSICKAKLI